MDKDWKPKDIAFSPENLLLVQEVITQVSKLTLKDLLWSHKCRLQVTAAFAIDTLRQMGPEYDKELHPVDVALAGALKKLTDGAYDFNIVPIQDLVEHGGDTDADADKSTET